MAGTLFKKFAGDGRGTAAIEFALSVPVLLIGLLGVVDLGNVVYQKGDLEAALRSGIQYFMSGGSNLTTAQNVVNASWTHKPVGATVVAEKYCLCGTTVSVCTALCGTGKYPVSYSRIVVNVTFHGILSNSPYQTSQVVRVR